MRSSEHITGELRVSAMKPGAANRAGQRQRELDEQTATVRPA